MVILYVQYVESDLSGYLSVSVSLSLSLACMWVYYASVWVFSSVSSAFRSVPEINSLIDWLINYDFPAEIHGTGNLNIVARFSLLHALASLLGQNLLFFGRSFDRVINSSLVLPRVAGFARPPALSSAFAG